MNSPPDFINLMKRCWDREPGNRPLFEEIIDTLNNIDTDKFDGK